MTTRFLVGDVFDRMREFEDHSFDLIVTSPPFLCLRSYLPDGHPDKDREIGSEPTPAAYLDVLLALTAEWRRLLAPHGSIAVELGDTYAGSGGAGGDYDADGLREGQNRFRMDWKRSGLLPLSLAGIPDAYALSLEYGWNVLRRNAPDSPAGRWRVRNKKAWIRSNPPVGSLGTKNMRERSATSYITVACVGGSRWFDLDAVRTAHLPHTQNYDGQRGGGPKKGNPDRQDAGLIGAACHPGGAPPLDWWHHVDAIIDHELDQRAGKANGNARAAKGTARANTQPNAQRGGNWDTLDVTDTPSSVGARGVHIRRALEKAGILTTLDAYDISPRGYTGAHYAVWPPELVKLMISEMCPRRVCVECGVPSRWIVGEASYVRRDGSVLVEREQWESGIAEGKGAHTNKPGGATKTRVAPTLGWSDCGCPELDEWGEPKWRSGRILDPFVGSGTTLAVASGMGRDSVGIDLDERNAHLAEQRVGMFLGVDWGERGPTTELPPPEVVDAVEDTGLDPTFHRREPPDEVKHNDGRQPRRKGPRPIVNVPDQGGMFDGDPLPTGER